MLVKFLGIELEEGTFTRENYKECFHLYNLKNISVYCEFRDKTWIKWEYDDLGNKAFQEDSDGVIECTRLWLDKNYRKNDYRLK